MNGWCKVRGYHYVASGDKHADRNRAGWRAMKLMYQRASKSQHDYRLGEVNWYINKYVLYGK